jgi:hypothetical protein
MTEATTRAEEDTRALIAELEHELGVTGTAAVFRKVLALAKEAQLLQADSDALGEELELHCEAEARAALVEAEMARLKARLEIDHAYDGAGNRIPFPAGMDNLDDIACRDETIRQQDEKIAKLTEQRDVARHTNEALHRRAQKAEAFKQRHRGSFNYVINRRIKDNRTRRAAEASASALRDRVAVLESALKPFCFGDPALEQILFGAMPNTATCNLTVSLGDTRAARAALNGADHV